MNAFSLYTSCTLCPRKCGVNRPAGERGFCGADAELLCARAALHAWEEPCLTGEFGSGTVFFSGCNLRCVYCQNRSISRGKVGKPASPEHLAQIFLSLEAQHAANINLVTPTHYLPHLLEAIPLARKTGLSIPIVYNCGGYESVESLALLEGLIDIYLPDCKYPDSTLAKALSGAEDYPTVSKRAIREMVRQVGSPIFDQNGLLRRGVIVRHLVLPACAQNAADLIEDLFDTYGNRIIFSVMNQYTPPSDLPLPSPLDRPITEEEYRLVVSRMEQLGIVRAYLQEGGTVTESFIPAFNGEGV